MHEIPYGPADDRTRVLHVVSPSVPPDEPAPIAVFYHGGGWVKGTWRQFLPQAERLAALGMVAVLVEYRLDGPVVATGDAIKAMNAVVESAADLGADPARIVAVGGSAGGHLALATAVLDRAESGPPHRPAAFVLLNPVTDTTGDFPAGFGRRDFESDEQARRYSPLHHLGADFPPALIMHGTADRAVHHQNSVAFAAEVNALGGGPAELVLHPDQPHGFFNPGAAAGRGRAGAGDSPFELTTAEMIRFLQRSVLDVRRN